MLRRITIFTLLFIMLPIAYATINNPVDLLNKTVVKTQNTLIKNASEYQNNSYKLLNLIDKNIIPIVAPEIIAQLIVGKKKWSKATLEEQKQFIHTTTEMFTFIYSKNVAYAGKYKIRLFPFNKDDNIWQQKAIVIVNGKITNISNNHSSDFSIKMFQKDSKWHIYDLAIAGVGILKTYREQFTSYATVAQMINSAKKITTNIKNKNYPKLLDKT